jgi:ABC-2 type transport system ATP-binding protein
MRRVEIARSLLHRPRLLLLDEPTIGLDIKSRADLETHVRRLVEEERIGVLWATHLIDEVSPADEILVLHNGRLLAKGPVAAVINQAGSEDIRGAFAKLTGPVRAVSRTEAA